MIEEIKNSEEFENEIKSNAIVFADFYATWCMPCKMMSGIIDEIAKEHQEVKFIKIDVDQNTELAIKYNVMSIPTMIIIVSNLQFNLCQTEINLKKQKKK